MYSVHYPHSIPPTIWTDSFRKVISIDPGEKNFLFRVEIRRETTTEVLIFEKVNLSEKKPKKDKLCTIFNNLKSFLDHYEQDYTGAHLVIVERQYKRNTTVIRISQLVIDYFSTKLYNSELTPLIIEIQPTAKSKMLKAPPKCNLKKWCVGKAKEICIQRKDEISLKMIEDDEKPDDRSDSICQIEAFFLMVGLMTPSEIIEGPSKPKRERKAKDPTKVRKPRKVKEPTDTFSIKVEKKTRRSSKY